MKKSKVLDVLICFFTLCVAISLICYAIFCYEPWGSYFVIALCISLLADCIAVCALGE